MATSEKERVGPLSVNGTTKEGVETELAELVQPLIVFRPSSLPGRFIFCQSETHNNGWPPSRRFLAPQGKKEGADPLEHEPRYKCKKQFATPN